MLICANAQSNIRFTSNASHNKLAEWYSFLFQQLIPSVFAVFINLLDGNILLCCWIMILNNEMFNIFSLKLALLGLFSFPTSSAILRD